MGEPIYIANPEAVAKTFQADGQNSDLLSGGGLLEEQQRGLVTHIRNYCVMLADNLGADYTFPGNSPLGRAQLTSRYTNGSPFGATPLALRPGGVEFVQHSGGQISGIDDQLFAFGTVLTAATEGAQPANAYDTNFAKFARRRWELQKLRASYAFTTEFITRNIAGQTLNGELERTITPIIGQNLEDLALNGDEDLAPDGSQRTAMLRVNNGWRKILREQSQNLSGGGEYIEPELFVQAVKSTPAEYGMLERKWFMNDRLWLDWIQKMGARSPNAMEASMSLIGYAPAPMGFQACLVPTMPFNLPLAKIGAALPARILSTRPIGGSFPADAYQISIDVDAQGAEIIVFPTVNDSNPENRYLRPHQIANTINQQYGAAHGENYANIARVSQHGFLELVGHADNGSIVLAAPANSALAILGLSSGAVNGQAANANNTNIVYEGAEVIFAPAQIFRFHYGTAAPGSAGPAGIRQFMKFSQEKDAYLYDMYLWTDATISEPEAAIYMSDIRLARPGVRPINP